MLKPYDVIIIGAGAGGIFAALSLLKENSESNILIIEKGKELSKRICPIDGEKIKSCIHCNVCAIMHGYGGAGTLSDGKYNITNNFGGELYKYIGYDVAIKIMREVDDILCQMGGKDAKLYSTSNSKLKSEALKYDLHLLDAEVRHLGTDRNIKILNNIYDFLKDKITIKFSEDTIDIEKNEDFTVTTNLNSYKAKKVIVATGRSGSKWISSICKKLQIETRSNRVDIGVRIEIPHAVFAHITDEVYESKIMYRTKKYSDMVRTFCMNPHGEVVTENTNGIVTVNGHSYSNPELHTDNTNFALLVSNKFTEPFRESNEYGESIAKLSNMLGGGVIVQRFGDLIKGRRTNESRILKSFTIPTLKATPGDLSLVLPKRQLDDIIEMIFALDKIAPGMSNEDTLLYGIEVKFYNSNVEVDNNLQTKIEGLYIIGDCSGVTHSLSQAAASGIYVGRVLNAK